MPVQKCPMCLEVKKVVSSHLIPAAIYDYCRTETDKPIRVGDGVIMHTDRQVQDDLLCLDCEDILNAGGETWANQKFATLRDGFPLYDLVTSVPPVWQDSDAALYSMANNPRVDLNKLTHFGLGVLWKASVHPWRRNDSTPLINLGPYSDQIRLWLRGRCPFPKNICLTVSLSRPENALVVIFAPVEVRPFSWHTFWFKVPGVVFTLHAGRDISSEMRECCLYTSPVHPIFVSEDITSKLWQRAGKDFVEARKTRSYLESRTRRAKAQGSSG